MVDIRAKNGGSDSVSCGGVNGENERNGRAGQQKSRDKVLRVAFVFVCFAIVNHSHPQPSSQISPVSPGRPSGPLSICPTHLQFPSVSSASESAHPHAGRKKQRNMSVIHHNTSSPNQFYFKLLKSFCSPSPGDKLS